jgi:WD40 repeat protein
MYPVFSPDGRFAAFWLDDGLAVASTETGKKVWAVPAKPRPFSFALAPDGRRIAVGANDDDKGFVIAVYDFQAGKLLSALHGHTNVAYALAFSPDGKLLASGSHDFTVRLWDPDAGKEIHRLGEPEKRNAAIYVLAFAPDGKAVVFVRNDRLTRWDWGPGTVIEETDQSAYRARSLVFTPDGRRLLVAREEGSTSVLDAATFKSLQEYPRPPKGLGRYPLALSPDGKTVAAGWWYGVVLWDLESGRDVTPRRDETFFADSARWSPDGKAVAVRDPYETVRVCDATTGKVLRRLDGVTGAMAAWPRDGTLVTLEEGGKVAFRDDRTGKPVREFDSGNPAERHGYHVSPDGRWLLANYAYLRMFDLDSGKEGALDFPGVGSRIAYAADGKRFAYFSAHGVQVRDSASGKVVWSFDPPPRARITRGESLVFSPDGQTLAMSDAEPEPLQGESPRQIVRLLDLKTGQIRHALPEKPTRHGWYALAVSPDGRLLAGGAHADPRIHLWDLDNGRPLAPVEGHQGPQGSVNTLAFSPDGKRLLSCGSDGCALVWDVAALLAR